MLFVINFPLSGKRSESDHPQCQTTSSRVKLVEFCIYLQKEVKLVCRCNQKRILIRDVCPNQSLNLWAHYWLLDILVSKMTHTMYSLCVGAFSSHFLAQALYNEMQKQLLYFHLYLLYCKPIERMNSHLNYIWVFASLFLN